MVIILVASIHVAGILVAVAFVVVSLAFGNAIVHYDVT